MPRQIILEGAALVEYLNKMGPDYRHASAAEACALTGWNASTLRGVKMRGLLALGNSPDTRTKYSAVECGVLLTAKILIDDGMEVAEACKVAAAFIPQLRHVLMAGSEHPEEAQLWVQIRKVAPDQSPRGDSGRRDQEVAGYQYRITDNAAGLGKIDELEAWPAYKTIAFHRIARLLLDRIAALREVE